MDVVFNCPKCNQELEVDAAGAGEEIECPSCANTIRIPADAKPAPPSAEQPAAAEAAAPRWGGAAVNAIASSAAAKVEMHLKVPARTAPSEKLVTNPPVPLEVAAKMSDRVIKAKTIKRGDCIEVGHDKFDDIVSAALAKIGEQNIVSITPLNYSHIDVASQKLLADYGILIIYKG